jgi:hypothetical protein
MCLEGVRKITKSLSQVRLCSGRDSNQLPPECKLYRLSYLGYILNINLSHMIIIYFKNIFLRYFALTVVFGPWVLF